MRREPGGPPYKQPLGAGSGSPPGARRGAEAESGEWGVGRVGRVAGAPGLPLQSALPSMSHQLKERRRTRVSHKVIEKRRRDRINRCLNELGKTVPMALAKQTSGKLEKAEILEMTVQYLRALHSADFPRGREKELLAEFANYFHYGYRECMRNLVHYLTTVERPEARDTEYARILGFLQSKARLGAAPALPPPGPLPEPDLSCPLHPAGPELGGHGPGEAAAFPQGAAPAPLPWPPYLPGAPAALPSPPQPHSPFLAPGQGLDRHYLSLIGHSHPNGLSLHPPQHPQAL